jgi:hypothetical protein
VLDRVPRSSPCRRRSISAAETHTLREVVLRRTACRVAAALTQQPEIGQRSATPRWSITRRLKGDRSLRSPWEWLIVPERGYGANVTKMHSGTRAPHLHQAKPGTKSLFSAANEAKPRRSLWSRHSRGSERFGSCRSPFHRRQESRRRPSASIETSRAYRCSYAVTSAML